MVVENYNINMQSSSSFIQSSETFMQSNIFTQELNGFNKSESSDIQNLSEVNYKSLVFNIEDNLSIQDIMNKRIIELLFGRLVQKNHYVSIYPFCDSNKNSKYEFNPEFSNSININSFGASFESTHTYYQKSSIDFSSSAHIVTNNGTFDIDLNLSFTQEFYEEHKTKIEFGSINLQDPLIINFKEDLQSFDNIERNLTFEFDLNSDGTKQRIPLIKESSGFLALDKNGNNQIDNGSELFGPKTGDGFEELAQYDEDKNNWIDETDSIFKDLRVWQVGKDGEGRLITLGEAGVGAIYLSSIATGFNYSNSIEEPTASLKESSIFLKESGEAGLITSVDLVV